MKKLSSLLLLSAASFGALAQATVTIVDQGIALEICESKLLEKAYEALFKQKYYLHDCRARVPGRPMPMLDGPVINQPDPAKLMADALDAAEDVVNYAQESGTWNRPEFESMRSLIEETVILVIFTIGKEIKVCLEATYPHRWNVHVVNELSTAQTEQVNRLFSAIFA